MVEDVVGAIVGDEVENMEHPIQGVVEAMTLSPQM